MRAFTGSPGVCINALSCCHREAGEVHPMSTLHNLTLSQEYMRWHSIWKDKSILFDQKNKPNYLCIGMPVKCGGCKGYWSSSRNYCFVVQRISGNGQVNVKGQKGNLMTRLQDRVQSVWHSWKMGSIRKSITINDRKIKSSVVTNEYH